MIEMLITILTSPVDAWITNGTYRLFEKDGQYYIAEHNVGKIAWKPTHHFNDLVIALSKYIELAGEK